MVGCGDQVTLDSPGSGDTDSALAGVDESLNLDDVLTIAELSPGDLSCLTPPITWMTQMVDPSCVEMVPVEGRVEDFQTGSGVSNAFIDMWFDDVVDDTPDLSMTSDGEGDVSGGSAPTCTAWVARSSTDESRDETKDVVQYHFIEKWVSPMDAFYNSVSNETYQLMPAILGLTTDEDKGVVAGTAYDCGGWASTVEGIQVVVKDSSGDYPPEQEVRYFLEEFPSRDQPHTSEDGLFLIVNIPVGEVTVEAYAILEDGGEPVMVGQTSMEIFADTLHIGDVYLGSDDGVVFPDACTEPCEL